jgi:hypothetical protein
MYPPKRPRKMTKLRRYIYENDIQQREICARIDIDKDRLSRIVSGSQPTPTEQAEICGALGLLSAEDKREAFDECENLPIRWHAAQRLGRFLQTEDGRDWIYKMAEVLNDRD